MNSTKAIPSLGDRVAATILVDGQPVRIEGTCRGRTIPTAVHPARFDICTDDGCRHNDIPAINVTLIRRGTRQTVPSIVGGTTEIGETA